MAEESLEDQLCNASACGNLSDVLLLLNKGANINGFNIYRRTALQVVKLGCTALVDVLLSAGADHTVRDPVYGLTVLHDAAREGFEDTVRVLLEHGADVNAADESGKLPLHLASEAGHQSVVKLLEGQAVEMRTRKASMVKARRDAVSGD